jgi:hypothetical protein
LFYRLSLVEGNQKIADVFGPDHGLAIGTTREELDTFELDASGCDLLRFE